MRNAPHNVALNNTVHALLAFACVAIAGCSYVTKAEGCVVDKDNAPVAGAKVVMMGRGAGDEIKTSDAVTDDRGCFVLAGRMGVPYDSARDIILLTISSEGYEEYVLEIPFGVSTKGLSVKLNAK